MQFCMCDKLKILKRIIFGKYFWKHGEILKAE